METELIDSFERFRQALARHNRAGEEVGPDPAHVLASADEVLIARVDLYRCLMRAGWTPPAEILPLVTADSRLSHEADDRDLGGDRDTTSADTGAT